MWLSKKNTPTTDGGDITVFLWQLLLHTLESRFSTVVNICLSLYVIYGTNSFDECFHFLYNPEIQGYHFFFCPTRNVRKHLRVFPVKNSGKRSFSFAKRMTLALTRNNLQTINPNSNRNWYLPVLYEETLAS